MAHTSFSTNRCPVLPTSQADIPGADDVGSGFTKPQGQQGTEPQCPRSPKKKPERDIQKTIKNHGGFNHQQGLTMGGKQWAYSIRFLSPVHQDMIQMIQKNCKLLGCFLTEDLVITIICKVSHPFSLKPIL